MIFSESTSIYTLRFKKIIKKYVRVLQYILSVTEIVSYRFIRKRLTEYIDQHCFHAYAWIDLQSFHCNIFFDILAFHYK